MGPQQLREAARLRSEHLGLSALDVSLEQDGGAGSKTDTSTPLFKSPQTVTSLLSKAQHANRIRLDGLTSSFLEPLQAFLGDKPYLLSEGGPSTLDCLAIGHLALALVPGLPQPWLAQSIRTKFTKLARYVDNLSESFHGICSDLDASSRCIDGTARTDASCAPADDAGDGDQVHRLVKYRPRSLQVTFVLLDCILDSVPFIKQYRAASHLQLALSSSCSRKIQPLHMIEPVSRHTGYITLGAITLGISTAVAYLFIPVQFPFSGQNGGFRWGRRAGLGNLGEAGAALAVLSPRLAPSSRAS